MPDANTTPAESPSPETLRRLTLWKALLSGLRATWDRLGMTLAISLLWAFLLMCELGVWRGAAVLSPFLGNILGIALVLLINPALFAGAAFIARLHTQHDEATLADLWRGAKRFYPVATRLGLFQAAVTAMLAFNLQFYGNWKALPGIASLLLCFYVALFWTTMLLYQYPLLIVQEMGLLDEPERGHLAKRGAIAVIRRSFYLTFGSPIYSFGFWLATLLLTALLFVPAVTFVSLWLGLFSFVSASATHTLLLRYGALPMPPQEEAVPDLLFRLGGATPQKRPEDGG